MASAFALSGSGTESERTSLRTVDLRGPAGRLEAVLNEGAPDSPVAALVCHPHPLGGGTMHNKVVYHAAKVMNSADWGLRWPVLRFNFRGTGLSEGAHDGHAESADVTAAVTWLKAQYRLPIVVVGFSFGAVMALDACCGSPHSNVVALAALGLPTQGFGHNFRHPLLAECKLPKLFLSGDRDQFAPAEELRSAIQAAADPKQFILIPGADHFFSGRLELMQQALAGWLKEQVK
jgi:alpha/beta superfamily hydrolase